jgi:hypothetical protein
VLIARVFVVFPEAVVLWAAIAQTALLLWWLFVYLQLGESPVYAVIAPLGAAVVFYIFARAWLRGQNVSWKGRSYVSS